MRICAHLTLKEFYELKDKPTFYERIILVNDSHGAYCPKYIRNTGEYDSSNEPIWSDPMDIVIEG